MDTNTRHPAPTTKRTVRCSKCTSPYAERTYDDDDNPTWTCANCYTVTPRQTRRSAKARRHAELIDQLVANATATREED